MVEGESNWEIEKMLWDGDPQWDGKADEPEVRYQALTPSGVKLVMWDGVEGISWKSVDGTQGFREAAGGSH